MEVALFAVAMTIGLLDQTKNLSKKSKSQQTWLLARLKEEHLCIVIIYLVFFSLSFT